MGHKIIQRTLLACLAGALGITARAAETGLDTSRPNPYRIARWTTVQGLPQNRISCLKHTRDGYLWIGTWFGLVRFDGWRFTVFDKFNTPELVDDTINALAEDRNGTLWIATLDGLVSYRAHQFHRLTKAEGLLDPRVRQLAARKAGGIWLNVGEDNVMHWAGGKFSADSKPTDSGNRRIRMLQEDADGALEVFASDKWLTWLPNATEVRTNQVLLANEPIWETGLASRQPGRVWAGTRHGLKCWENGGAKMLANNPFSGKLVDFIYEDQATNLWVNLAPGRLFRQDGDRWLELNVGSLAAPVITLCMDEDEQGNLWLGTDQGLFHLRKWQVRAYTTQDGLAAEQAWSVCEGTDGAIWVGTDDGFSRILNQTVASFNVRDFPANECRCVWPASSGGVRIATRGDGVYEWKDQVRLLVPIEALPHRKVAALYEDHAGRLWIGTENGVAVWNDGQVTATYTNWAGRSGYDVRCILEDRAGTFWFGTQGQGLTRLRNGVFDVFTEREGLCDNQVWAIHEDAAGTLWLGTENGLLRYQQGRFFTFARKEGLLENTVNWILEDDSGYLWLSGQRGIYRIQREQLNDVAAGRAASVRVATFGTADGMESNESNGEGQPAGWKTRDDQLWFPTTRGVVVIDPKKVDLEEAPAPVAIEQVKADDKIIFGDGAQAEVRAHRPKSKAGLALGPDPEIPLPSPHLAAGRAQLVEISYTANTFVDSRRTRFRYRLVGSDRNWHEETTARVAHYTNLRPGNYQFELVAANHYGVWSPVPATFAFSLAPHFYETWPFYLACVAAVIAVVAGVQGFRLRWQHRMLKMEQAGAIADERTRIARDLHDDLGTALTGLALELNVVGRKAQMSPALADHLSATAQRARDLAERMREVVWSVSPQCDTLSSLASFLEQQIHQFLRATEVRVRLDFPEEIPPLPLSADARHQLALGVREALTNVVRHAQASEVVVSLAIAGETLILQIKDNGRGFQTPDPTGQGLENMRSRLEWIGGSFRSVSTPNVGTVIEFRLPLNPPAPTRKTPS